VRFAGINACVLNGSPVDWNLPAELAGSWFEVLTRDCEQRRVRYRSNRSRSFAWIFSTTCDGRCVQAWFKKRNSVATRCRAASGSARQKIDALWNPTRGR